MPYAEVTGDLLELDLPAIGHGCNCLGVMGAGVAAAFRERYPAMYDAYRTSCRRGEYSPGDVMSWHASDGTWVYNLFTQHMPGPGASLDAITRSVWTALGHAVTNRVERVGIPRLGCGIGGLRWHDVRRVLRKLGEGEPAVKLVVVSLFNADQPHG